MMLVEKPAKTPERAVQGMNSERGWQNLTKVRAQKKTERKCWERGICGERISAILPDAASGMDGRNLKERMLERQSGQTYR